MLHHMALFITKGTLLISRALLYPPWFFCTSVAPIIPTHWRCKLSNPLMVQELSKMRLQSDMTVPLLNLQRRSEFPDNCNTLHWAKFSTNAPQIIKPLRNKIMSKQEATFFSCYFTSFSQLKTMVQKSCKLLKMAASSWLFYIYNLVHVLFLKHIGSCRLIKVFLNDSAHGQS